ncbi:MAG TPA: Rieske 2Fe-2S domain-containing protein [candidate division Zixibacteria bacterium]|nr:Rieske 2Fe-2S domain-containing protein [candidate division Zixibacteria bacterium]
MISREENELLTRTERGTPCGELLRRYWQPAALAEELPPGGAPLRVTILGEELVLFRDDRGRPGLLGLHCAHRGTDLSYGRVERGGLRCLYHGWLYDIHGAVLEQPGEPGGGADRHRLRHLAYPCREAGGVIFAYLGPGEPPLLPNYEFLAAPEERRTVTKILYRCNFLQANEGNIDPVHLSFLHRYLGEAEIERPRVVAGSGATDNTLLSADPAPIIEVEPTRFGLRIHTVREAQGGRYLRITNFVFPNLAAFGGSTVGEGYAVHWHVPIDDVSHWKYVFAFSRERPLDPALHGKSRFELTADYRLERHELNRYGQDRESMKNRSFTGMGFNFQAHDAFATESQGAIQDRTVEHLVSSDKAIVAARKLLLSGIRAVAEGRDPLHVVRSPETNRFPDLVVISELLPPQTDWKQYARTLIGAARETSGQPLSGG